MNGIPRAAPQGGPGQIPPEVLAKMTTEQRAQMEMAMKNMPKGAMMPPAAPASPLGGGLAGKIAKMTRKVDVGGPENWGQIAARGHWDQLGSQLPSIKK